MPSYSKKTKEQIGRNLALGMSNDLAVAQATGKDKTAVNKYAYKVVQHEDVQAAMELYSKEFQKRSFVTKEMLEAKLASMIFRGEDEELKPMETIAAMKLVADLNGHTAKAKQGQQNADTKRGTALSNMANKFHGNE